eukprot:2983638-Pleurochrysis_carterae.AAC.1
MQQRARAGASHACSARVPWDQEHRLPDLRCAIYKLVEEFGEVESEDDDGQLQHGCGERKDHAVGGCVSDCRLDFAVPLRVGLVGCRLHWAC